MEPHETADAYRAARRAGDDNRCKEIVAEVNARYATRATDGTELQALQQANYDTPLAQPAN